jgi:ATP-dependent helicase HrpB
MPPPQGLTIEPALPELQAMLHQGNRVVLHAPTGAGKTTAVPLAMLGCNWLNGQKIVILQPRRLAARAAAHRMAAMLAEPVGATVGYRIRQDRNVGPKTRIEVVTEGILTRHLQSDPFLEGIGLVIFDEYHERSIHADLGLALTLDVQSELRSELRILIMSATLDTAAVAQTLSGASVVTVQGSQYPVKTQYLETVPPDPVAAAARTVAGLWERSGSGDILVFLPGVAEIQRSIHILNRSGPPRGVRLHALYGRLSGREQDLAIRPSPIGRRKVVLSTSLAETSLTIEGVRTVVDAGLMRIPRYDVRCDMTRLVTVSVTRDAARQRRGRAGRTRSGCCYRMWSRHHHDGLTPSRRPEILESDLCQVALELALWGVADPSRLRWADPPPEVVFGQARDLLVRLGALDRTGHITGHGRRLAALPLHPRLGHMVLTAGGPRHQKLAVDLAALLVERDLPAFRQPGAGVDLARRLETLTRLRRAGRDKEGGLRVLSTADDLRRRLRLTNVRGSAPIAAAGELVASAYPQRVAQLRPGTAGRFRLASGRGARLPPSDPLSTTPYLAVAQVDAGERDARIFLAAAVSANALESRFSDVISTETAVHWEAERDAVVAATRRCFGALVLSEKPLGRLAPDIRAQAIVAGLRRMGLTRLPWNRSLRNWQARVAFAKAVDGTSAPWPDTSEAGLLARIDTWLTPELEKAGKLSRLQPRDLQRALAALLDWRLTRRLDELAPMHYTAPSGSRIPIDYTAKPTPVLGVRLQEMFGCPKTPTIAGGRVRLMLHLLSPARRPVQITNDLAGFWNRTYPEVKKELKGRYPKHAWPDDPLQARPLKGVPSRSSR